MEGDSDVGSAASTFHLLSNEFRVSILRELARHDGALKFSELRAALGDVDSGRLNYHLKELVGPFVDRGEGAYALTVQGNKIVSSILASRYVDAEVTYSVPVSGTCYDCGAADLELEQTGQQAFVRCTVCERDQFRKSVTAVLWEHRDREAVPDALDRVFWSDLELATNRVCRYCQSTMTPRVAENDWESELYSIYDFDVLAVYDCELCTNWYLASYGLVAWLHSDVRSFHREFGIDPETVKCWQVDQGMDPQYTSVLSTDPYEIAVRFSLDDAECRVTFDDQNEVVSVHRGKTYSG